MRKSTLEKLFGNYDDFRIVAGTMCDGDTGHHWTTLLVGSKVCRVQEYANEADGFEVWLPVEGNSVEACREAIGLSPRHTDSEAHR